MSGWLGSALKEASVMTYCLALEKNQIKDWNKPLSAIYYEFSNKVKGE
jgi:hypothetical protein